MKNISDRVLRVLEWPALTEKITNHCHTSNGKKLAQETAPLEKNEISKRLKKITSLKELILRDEAPEFFGVTDITEYIVRTEKKAVLSLEELYSVRNLVMASSRMKKYLREWTELYPALKEEHDSLDPLKELTSLLSKSITEDGELNQDHYPVLKKLRKNISTAKHDAEKSINGLIHSQALENALQEKIHTTMNQRYVLLLKSSMKNRIKGTVLDMSSSGATLFFEPDSIRDLNEKIIMSELELQQEIRRILKDLSASVGENSSGLRTNQDIMAYLDFLNAAAKFSIDINGNEPEISETPEIKLRKVRHPLLHIMLGGKAVPNDIEIGSDYNCLIISGANTGGKTVLMKTVGLALLCFMCGLHIPANADSEIGVFDSILADIGDDQSLEESLSTYSGQISVIKEMIERSDEKTLVLIDEIIVGTNPRHGAALAQSILEKMVDTGSRIITTTHYTELKEMASGDERFRNASVSFDMDTLKPTYRLITGIPGVSYAFEIARNYGLDNGILERATELFDSRDISIEALLEETQRFRQEIEEERNRIKLKDEELTREKKDYEQKELKLKHMTQEISNNRGIDFLDDLSEYRRLVSEKIASLQSADLREAGEIQKSLIGQQQKVRGELEDRRNALIEEEYSSVDPEKLYPGYKVFVRTLEKEGTVETVDSSGESAVILFGGTIRSRFKLEDLFERPGSFNQSGTVKRTKKKKIKPMPTEESYNDIPTVIQTSYNTIDLRGKRVEEALSFMEKGFDSISRSSTQIAIVIHGHGTGALKQAVRENLKFSIYVRDFRIGDPSEGGDGVTVARLR